MLSVGDRVRIQGLKSERALHLNQTYGLVTGYVKEKQRYRVHLVQTSRADDIRATFWKELSYCTVVYVFWRLSTFGKKKRGGVQAKRRSTQAV